MRTQHYDKKVNGILKSKSVIFMIVLVAGVLQTANALEWERMVGEESPGVLIFDERPVCSFSIYKSSPLYYIESPSSLIVSNITYDLYSRVIEYYANGTGNGHPVESHVYGGTYNGLGQLTAFHEVRYYPESGHVYAISISNAKYDENGNVKHGYDVIINPDAEPPEMPPEMATNPSPANSATNQEITVELSWSDGGGATSYNVYFGTDSTLDDDEFKGNQTQRIYDPGTLLYGTTYYWRIDAMNDQEIITEGDVWSFTTVRPIIFVDDDASGDNDGTSWANAYNYLQDALANAASAGIMVEIRVAQGIYKPDRGNHQILDDRVATFQLINGVAIKGGYAGFGQQDPNSRDIEIFETILSGDLSGGNSYHVVIGSDTDESAELDGFTISSGNADAVSGSLSMGGGMYNDSGSPSVANCIFSGNLARSGGGMCNDNYSSPILTNCIFSGNSATQDGGGMYNDFGSGPIMFNCIFVGNLATRNGGGMYNWSNWSSHIAELTNCILWDNAPMQITGDATIFYSNIQGGWPGEGNIDADPLFADLENGDYHLKSEAGRWDPVSQSWVRDNITSPCIDAGDPYVPVGDEPLPHGGIINMGVYGGTERASKSLSLTILHESFDDGNYDGWALVDQGTESGPMDWLVANGAMAQTSNVFTLPTGNELPKPGTYAWYTEGIGWTDYNATITIRSDDDDTIGFMFRYQDEDNYYRFSWDKQRNYRRLVKCQDGQFTLLAQDSVPYITGHSYQLEIAAQASTLQVSIDGSVIFSVDDSGLSSGTIALYSWGNAGSYFDDIIVEIPNRPPVISFITATPSVIFDDETSKLQLSVEPDDGPEALTYSWTVKNGKVDDPTIPNPIYTPPDVDSIKNITLTVQVSDGKDTISKMIDIMVMDADSTILYENFDDGDYDGWAFVDQGTNDGPMDWSVADGAMVQSSNVYTFPTGNELPKPGTYAWYTEGTGWGDYKTTVTIKSDDNDAIGIMFRFQDEDNYYRFSWDKQRSYRRLSKCENGQFTLLAQDSVPYITGQSYQLEIVAQASALQVYIDSSPIFAVDDSGLASGTIALYSWGNAGSYFDDVVVELISP